MPEAQLEDFGSGLTPVTQGWFVVNVQDAEWWFAERRGARCAFENEYGDSPVEFDQFGINVTVLEPGETGLYHAESNQEAFLVLSGECVLLVEDEERRLRPWDFFHSSPWTEHAFVGVGEGPCVILMVGSRSGREAHYPLSQLAARYGASVAEETSDWRQAYATVERFRRERPRTGLVCHGRRGERDSVLAMPSFREPDIASVASTRDDHGLDPVRGAAFAEVTAMGAPALADPHQWLGRLLITWVADPDGNPIQIVQHLRGG